MTLPGAYLETSFSCAAPARRCGGAFDLRHRSPPPASPSLATVQGCGRAKPDRRRGVLFPSCDGAARAGLFGPRRGTGRRDAAAHRLGVPAWVMQRRRGLRGGGGPRGCLQVKSRPLAAAWHGDVPVQGGSAPANLVTLAPNWIGSATATSTRDSSRQLSRFGEVGGGPPPWLQ